MRVTVSDLAIGILSSPGLLSGAGDGPSHRLHQQRRGVVHELVHGDHRRLLAAQHIARVTEIPHKITGTTLS